MDPSELDAGDLPLDRLIPRSLAERIRARTPARIFTGPADGFYRTSTYLELRRDHAAAKDAVNARLDLTADLGSDLVTQWQLFEIATLARTRETYLLHPELGRSLDPSARAELLARCPTQADFQVVIADGLSAAAVRAQAPSLLTYLAAESAQRAWRFGQPFFVRHGRVGLMNDVGDILEPRVVVLLIGERPGLATAESLSAYMAYRPRPGNDDSHRNLISNIHARGIPTDEAAVRVARLAATMMELSTSGVAIKEQIAVEHGVAAKQLHRAEIEGESRGGLTAMLRREYNVGMNSLETPLIQVTDSGLYCEQGGFFIDPWKSVDRAVVTHAHSDHLHWGCGRYLVAAEGITVTRARLKADSIIDTIPYGEPIDVNGVRVSFHSAGHILGSAQVRLEHRGRIWVASGDYKTEPDLTCAPFEPVRCHLFISECTFGLPIYRWPTGSSVMSDVLKWWQANRAAGRASVLYAYALGKAQRLIAGVAAAAARGESSVLPGPIYTHGAVEPLNRAYREAGIELPPTTYASQAPKGTDWSSALILAPPSAHNTPWSRRFNPSSSAFASGWMRIRGTRRRRAVDRGFVLSDHADWPGLLAAIESTGAETVWLTHGYTAPLTRWLRDQGKNAEALTTHYEGETDREEPAEASEVPLNDPTPAGVNDQSPPLLPELDDADSNP